MEEERRRQQPWEKRDELKEYVYTLKKLYPLDLDHIQPENLLYVGFSKKRSSCAANIRNITGVWSLFKNEAYILAIHIETWESLSEHERLYVIFHELLHIPEYGFIEGEKEYKKLVRHDLQDFKLLVAKFGVWKEDLEKILKKQSNEFKAETE